MSPLQTAAQAVIDKFECSHPLISVSLLELRKALEAEQAQAVEPVGYFCSNPAGDFRYQVSLKAGYPGSVPLYTHPAPPPTGERAELIARLIRKADAWDHLQPGAKRLNACRQASDMLKADAASQARERHTRATLNKVLAGLNEAQQVVLTDIEQYRMQMAGISTAALGYWSEGDEIHPDYDTPALRDVARLYKKYDQLFKEKDARRAQQVAVPDGWVMVPTETLLDIKNRVNTLATLSLKAERYSVGREIKQDIADMLAAAQGAKP